MAGRKVTPEQLGVAIQEILDEYGDEVNNNIEEITTRIAKKGVQALRSASSIFGGSGKYKSGWKVEFENTRYSKTAKIWNAKVPGLPHLLEYGHLLRNGSRAPGRTHIAPIEDQLVREYEEMLEQKL